MKVALAMGFLDVDEGFSIRKVIVLRAGVDGGSPGMPQVCGGEYRVVHVVGMVWSGLLEARLHVGGRSCARFISAC